MDRCPQCRGPLAVGFTVYGIEVRRCMLTGRPSPPPRNPAAGP